MDCRGSHLLCKEDTFLSMYFPVRPRLDSTTVRDGPGELRADLGGSYCQLPSFLPPPLESRRSGELRGRGKDCSWLREPSNFYFCSEWREEGTHFTGGKFKNYICTWIAWKRGMTWRRVWETWEGWFLTIWALYSDEQPCLSAPEPVNTSGSCGDSREPSPGIWQPWVPACWVGIAPSEVHPWNKGALLFTSRPWESPALKDGVEINVMQTRLYSQFFKFHFFPNWAWMACGCN